MKFDTYSKIITIFLISLISLVNAAVLSHASGPPQKCEFPAGIVCGDFMIREGIVSFLLKNVNGSNINISSIKVEGCTGTDSGFLRNGEQEIFTVDGCKHAIKSGSRFKGKINVTFVNVETNISNMREAFISGIVEKSTTKISVFNIIKLYIYNILLLILIINLPLPISFFIYRFLKGKIRILVIVLIVLLIIILNFFNLNTSPRWYKYLIDLISASVFIIFPVIILFYLSYKLSKSQALASKIKFSAFLFITLFLLFFLPFYYGIGIRLKDVLLLYSLIITPIITSIVLYKFLKGKSRNMKIIAVAVVLMLVLLLLLGGIAYQVIYYLENNLLFSY